MLRNFFSRLHGVLWVLIGRSWEAPLRLHWTTGDVLEQRIPVRPLALVQVDNDET